MRVAQPSYPCKTNLSLLQKSRDLGKVGECCRGTKSLTGKGKVSRRFPLESQKTEGSSQCLLLCMISIQNEPHIFPPFNPIVALFFFGGSFLFVLFFLIFSYFAVTQNVLLNYITKGKAFILKAKAVLVVDLTWIRLT